MASSRIDAPFAYVLRSIGHRIRRCHQLSVGLFVDEVSTFEVTTVQYAALAAIVANRDIDATRLAALVDLDRSTVGAVLERLEAKGLITRHYGSRDKRIKLLRATATGRELLVKADAAVHRSQSRFLEVLEPAERQMLLDLLQKLTTRHEALDEAV